MDKISNFNKQVEEENYELIQQLHREYANKIMEVQHEMMNRYIPCHGDVIDESLARVINNSPECEKMKLMFLRESQGVYRFGQKQVAIKCDRN